MKRFFALTLALMLMISMAACTGGNTEQAFTVSQQAFDQVNEAYMQVNTFSKDIYEAWHLGVNNSRYGCDFDEFASEMYIDRQYIEQAVAQLSGKDAFSTSDWSSLHYSFNSSRFSAYVAVISTAYECSGDTEKIATLLTEAKLLMKQLSSEYSDYEHYPALKTYFTNTLAFFDFCKNPEGSFEQVVETFNGYRNVARECFFELNYIFSDDIGGMGDIQKDDTASEA